MIYWARGESVFIPGRQLLHRVHADSLSILSRSDRPALVRKLGTPLRLKEERRKFTAALQMGCELLPLLERFGSPELRAEALPYLAAAGRGTVYRMIRLLPMLLRDLPVRFVLERLPML